MRCASYVLVLVFVLLLAGCGGNNNNTPNNVGLFGNWNVVMYPTGNANPAYVFALAISQEGTNSYSGSSITYTGSVPAPSGICINASGLRMTGTTNSSNSNFTMTITDPTSQTVITAQGILSSVTTSQSGTYTNPASGSCPASSGTFTMTAQ